MDRAPGLASESRGKDTADAAPATAEVSPIATASDDTVAARDTARLRLRVALAAATVLLTDAVVAAVSSSRAHAGVRAVLASAAEVIGITAFPTVLPASLVALLVARSEIRSLLQHGGQALSSASPRHARLAVVLWATAVAGTLVGIRDLGVRLADHRSVRVVIVVTIALVLASLVLSAVAVALVFPMLARAARALERRMPWFPAGPAGDLALASVAVVVLVRSLTPALAVTPAAGLVAFALAPVLGERGLRVFRPLMSRAPAWCGGALLATASAAVMLDHVPGAAQVATLYRAPYASLLVSGVRAAFDRDGDGYSPILLGGDCDDRDPQVHPGAYDRPNDGIDQNCSGADAQRYAPHVQIARTPPGAVPSRLNVVLVQMDALRPDHVGFVGYRRKTSPSIDRFRERATWFANAYTPAPTTRLAMASIFTGLPIERIPQRRGPGVDFTLLPEAQTLAERLATLDYDRVGFTISYVVQHIKDIGQGFRTWDTPWPPWEYQTTYATSAELTTDAATAYLAGVPVDGTAPFLLFVHYQCTHDPYLKHPSWDYGDAPMDLYDSALAYCDDRLGKLLETLDARADRDRTAILLFSDHGELFGEHGVEHHGNSLYEPDVRALLLARIPGARAGRVDDRVMLTDLAPTILELAGAPREPEPGQEAWSLVPYVFGVAKADAPRAMFLYADMWHGMAHYQARGVIDGSFKYTHDLGSGAVELFDLARDPDEMSNVADALPQVRNRLAERVDAWQSYEVRPP
jgi:hypothetical protein